MIQDRHKKALEVLKRGTVIPATVLALDKNRQFDNERQRMIIRYYLEAGAGGIATAVHTTQFEIRKPEINLYETVLSTVIDEIGSFEKETGKAIVAVAGVCGDTKQAVKEAETAKSFGYDAVLLSPGGLSELSEEELIERTRAVAKVMPVILFYLQTAVGGRKFSYSYWEKSCEIDGVMAIKCASFNRYSTLDVVRAAALSTRSGEIALYTGNDDNIVIDLATKYKFRKNGITYTKGFVGGLLGHWSVFTKSAVDMLNKIKSGEITGDDLLTLAAAVTDVNSALFDTANNFAGCIAGVHEILRRQGLLDGVWLLNPDETLSKGQPEEIDRVYSMYPELNDDAFVSEFIEKYKKHKG